MNDFDSDVAEYVAGHRTPALTHLAHAVTAAGNEVTIAVLSAVAIGLLWVVGRRYAAVVFAIGMAGSAVLVVGLKHLVGRERPGAEFRLGPPDSSFSFPSGHTLDTTVFSLMVVVALWPLLGRAGRWFAPACALLVSVAMACSRVYLGYHWTTDVIGGLVIGVVWSLTLAATASRVPVLRQVERVRA